MDEIEDWVIKELKSIGLDTAKSVLDTSLEELIKRTDLEEETIVEVQRILKEEFRIVDKIIILLQIKVIRVYDGKQKNET